MALPSYDTIARRVNVTRCRGLRPSGGYCRGFNHDKGEFEVEDRIIHWSDRHPTRAGIRRFLFVIADADIAQEHWSPWLHLYRSLMRLNTLAAEAQIRFPKDLSAEDRARLRAMLSKAPASPERDRARRWAQGH